MQLETSVIRSIGHFGIEEENGTRAGPQNSHFSGPVPFSFPFPTSRFFGPIFSRSPFCQEAVLVLRVSVCSDLNCHAKHSDSLSTFQS